MERPIRNLDELMDGAMTERFRRKWNEIMNNVMDPNTDPKAKRKMQITIELVPNERRDGAEYFIDFKNTLAPMRKLSQSIFLHMDDNGRVTATEITSQIPGQIDMYGDEQAPPRVVVFGQAQGEE